MLLPQIRSTQNVNSEAKSINSLVSRIPTISEVCNIPAGTYYFNLITYPTNLNGSYACSNGKSGQLSKDIPVLVFPAGITLSKPYTLRSGIYTRSNTVTLAQVCKSAICAQLCKTVDCNNTLLTYSAYGTLSCVNGGPTVVFATGPQGVKGTVSFAVLSTSAKQCKGTASITTGGTGSFSLK